MRMYFVLMFSEPTAYSSQENLLQLSAAQIANDYVIFHQVLESYPCFNDSRVFGPDIFPLSDVPEGQTMLQA